jgi:hypothetical protein
VGASALGRDETAELATEVLELGEALFDGLVEAITAHSDSADSQAAPPVAEIQAAADEFFVALRLLLGLEDGTS